MIIIYLIDYSNQFVGENLSLTAEIEVLFEMVDQCRRKAKLQGLTGSLLNYMVV